MQKIIGILDNYSIIETEDGGFTLYSKKFDEACHSLQGPTQETKTHYFDACQISQLADNHRPLNILEIGTGFGLGYKVTANSLAVNSHVKLNFISCEIDPQLIDWACKNISHENNFLPNFNQLQPMHYGSIPCYQATKNNCTFTVLIGDARNTIPQLQIENHDLKFHAIYQDAFSPYKNPTLWTVQWFEVLKAISDNNCTMSTYSSSSAIRKSMITAGWRVFNGNCFGKKRSSTIAKLEGETEAEILEHLNRSPMTPFFD